MLSQVLQDLCGNGRILYAATSVGTRLKSGTDALKAEWLPGKTGAIMTWL